MPPKKTDRKAKLTRPSVGLDDMPEAVFVVDQAQRIVMANRRLLDLLGYGEADLSDKPLKTLLPDPPRATRTVCKEGACIHEFATFVVNRKGEQIMMDFRAAPIEQHGKVVGVLYAGRDIRVRKLIEAEVRKARDYFRSIVEYSPSGICITDMGRNIILANKALSDMTGYSKDELVGRNVVDTFYPDDDVESRTLDIERLKRGERISRHIEVVDKEGKRVPAFVSYRHLSGLGQDGNGAIVESYSDETASQQLDLLKDEFVFVAAHELRNPATAIKLLLDIIFEDKRLTLDPILRNYLLKVQQAEERLMHLVDDLLEVSRSEVGRLKIKVGPEDLVGHVNEIINELRPSALDRDVRIVYNAPPRLPQVEADGVKLKEILANLVSNAIKYNIAGGSVTIDHEVTGDQVFTRVTDTGIGMTPEDQEMIGEKFWRSEDLAVRAQAGTGLGMFIVKELVHRMGGRFEVKSEHGKGSTFSFSLPVVRPAG
ncbi:hypothetical protein AMJ57_04420 [Parcubacteria bacterium SG8_24]|nr:MAG: hypothetical protein AMJ57_04420 [Parcubacteria bacterium SG8_24]